MFNLFVLLVRFQTFGLNLPVCSICQYLSGSKRLDGITLYVQLVSTSCVVQNVWMESPFMFNLSVLHVWFKTFRWNHPVYSTCLFFMSGSKLGWNHRVCSTSLVENFQKESSCMFNLSVLHVWFKTWIEPPCMFNLSVLHVWFKTFGWNHPVCSSCQYFMSGLKLLDGITLYVQIVCSSCLVQNFWMETPCMFKLSILHVWFKTFRLNHTICSTCQYFKSGSQLLDGITLYVQLISTSCLAQNFWIEPPCMFNLSVFHVWFKTWMESPCMLNLSVLHVWFKTFG
jgi:hypothetical protein